MSTKAEKKLNYNHVVEDNDKNEDEYKETIHSYRDEVGDDDYDYINNNRHSSFNDEYYD